MIITWSPVFIYIMKIQFVPFILVSCKKQLVNAVSGNNESLLQELYETKVHNVDSMLKF
jgi:hypothetical protein